MKTFKDILLVLAVISGFLLLGWLIVGNDLLMQKFFSPKQEQVRRETFEQSKAYRDGSVQELQNMQFAYINASPEHKLVLASIIKHRAITVPRDAMPSDLYYFIKELP